MVLTAIEERNVVEMNGMNDETIAGLPILYQIFFLSVKPG